VVRSGSGGLWRVLVVRSGGAGLRRPLAPAPQPSAVRAWHSGARRCERCEHGAPLACGAVSCEHGTALSRHAVALRPRGSTGTRPSAPEGKRRYGPTHSARGGSGLDPPRLDESNTGCAGPYCARGAAPPRPARRSKQRRPARTRGPLARRPRRHPMRVARGM
jgi:hypothetical protein